MHFTSLFVASLAACATALPNRRPGGFQNGRPGGQNNGLQNGQNGELQNDQPNPNPNNEPTQSQAAQATVAPEIQPSATAVPGNDEAGAGNNEGNNNTGNGNGNAQNGAFDAALVPEFGIEAGQNPDGTGNCSGNGGKLIPCQCPPDRDEFIQKVSAAVAAGNSEGVPVEFPTDDSSASEKARIQTSIVVLQNLNSKGVGCPAAATTFLEQQRAA